LTAANSTIYKEKYNQTAEQCAGTVNADIKRSACSAGDKKLMKFVCGSIEDAKAPCTKPTATKFPVSFYAVRKNSG
jgi:hypothetical protein